MKRPARRARFLVVAAGAALAAVLLPGGYLACSFSRVPDLFRLNKACQEEGYYMGEFEFKMLGLAYRLDKGRYSDVIGGLGDLHDQLKTRTGLIRVPRFQDKREELEFYLGLQNPQTGAFMDASYPYCVYEGPTGNVLEHLEALANETGQPLRLKYPLRFFDEIDTPDKLKAFLEDVTHVGWIASRLPQTSFHLARNHLSYAEKDNILERNNLYAFSPEWKHTLLEWFYENQDPETGFWGPRSPGNKKLVKLDLNNTSTIARSFVDRNGSDIHPEFPLRYKSQLFATALKVLAEPMPSREDLDELHEWALSQSKGLKTLMVYLWRDASQEHKDKTRQLLENYVRVTFDEYYVPHEGAFSFYPKAERATLDGTGSTMNIFRSMGAFSRAQQQRLWQGAEASCSRSELTGSRITEQDIAPLVRCAGANSIRLYDPAPAAESYTANVAWVVYPRKTPYLDAADLLPRVRSWLKSTPQSMGNWVSREGLLASEEAAGLAAPKGITHNFPFDTANELLRQRKRVTAIAFDITQIPRCRVEFRVRPGAGALQPDHSAQP